MPSAFGKVWIFIILNFLAPVSRGQDLVSGNLYPGIHSKAGSGAGLTISRGPGAIFHNPANIIFSKFLEPDGDFGVSITSYTYQHTDSDRFGPAKAQLTSVQTTLGGTVRPMLPLALSFAFIPRGLPTSKYSISEAPYHIGDGTYTLSNMDITQEGIILGGGAAYKVHPLVTLGGSAMLTNEKLSVLATEPNGKEPFFDMIYAGSYLQFALGARADLFKQKIALAFSFKSGAQKNFKGDYYLDQSVSTKNDYVPLEYQGYAPSSFGVGGEIQLGTFGAYGDFRFNQWSAGLGSRGLPNAPTATEYKNTFEIAAGGKYWFLREHMLMAGFGFVTPNVGDGSEYKTNPNEGFDGMGLAELQGMQRLIFSGGYRFRIKSQGYLMAGGQFQTGSRQVPEGFSYEGSHSVTTFLGSMGGAYGF
jgi:hypothetical protein